MVTGIINNERVHVLVNHWPSRYEGELETEPKRLIPSEKASEVIQKMTTEDPNGNSLKQLVNSNDLFNPTISLLNDKHGTIVHEFE